MYAVAKADVAFVLPEGIKMSKAALTVKAEYRLIRKVTDHLPLRAETNSERFSLDKTISNDGEVDPPWIGRVYFPLST